MQLALLAVLAVAVFLSPSVRAQERAPVVIRSSDYPAYALREGLEGHSRILLMVRPDGTVESCSILQSSGHGLLDDRACALYRYRARFDVSDDATMRRMIAPVRWQMDGGGNDNPLHVLAGFSIDAPELGLGGRFAWERLDAMFPGLCKNDAKGTSCTLDLTDSAWLGDGVVKDAELSFTPGDGRFVKVTVGINPMRMTETRQVLQSRLGKPCHVTQAEAVWVDGRAYAILKDATLVIQLRDTLSMPLTDTRCRPPVW